MQHAKRVKTFVFLAQLIVILHYIHCHSFFSSLWFSVDRIQIRKSSSLPNLKVLKHIYVCFYFKLNYIPPLVFGLPTHNLSVWLSSAYHDLGYYCASFLRHRIGTMYIVSFTFCFIDLNFNHFAFQSYLLSCINCVAVTLLVCVN